MSPKEGTLFLSTKTRLQDARFALAIGYFLHESTLFYENVAELGDAMRASGGWDRS